MVKQIETHSKTTQRGTKAHPLILIQVFQDHLAMIARKGKRKKILQLKAIEAGAELPNLLKISKFLKFAEGLAFRTRQNSKAIRVRIYLLELGDVM